MKVARREVNRAWLVHVKLCINGHLYSAVCILSRCVAMNYVQKTLKRESFQNLCFWFVWIVVQIENKIFGKQWLHLAKLSLYVLNYLWYNSIWHFRSFGIGPGEHVFKLILARLMYVFSVQYLTNLFNYQSAAGTTDSADEWKHYTHVLSFIQASVLLC